MVALTGVAGLTTLAGDDLLTLIVRGGPGSGAAMTLGWRSIDAEDMGS
jgi:hypothetical protein